MAGLVVAGLTTWQYEGTTAKKKHEHRISYLTGGGLLMEGQEGRPTGSISTCWISAPGRGRACPTPTALQIPNGSGNRVRPGTRAEAPRRRTCRSIGRRGSRLATG